MSGLNKVLIIGRLGQDPEKRVTGGGKSVVSLSVATSEQWNDQQGNKQERTEWHKIIFWEKSADLIEQYTKKGSQIYVEGTLQTRKWQDKDGNDRYTTEILAKRFLFLDSKPQGQGQQQGYQNQQNPTYQQPQQQQFNNQQQFSNNQPNQQGNQFQTPPAQNQQQPQGQPSVPNDDFIEDDIPF